MAGALFLPERRFTTGLAAATVLAIGPRVEHIHEGDTVLFPAQFTPNRVTLDGRQAEVLPFSDCLAFIPT